MKHTFQRITILLLALFLTMTLANVSYSQKIGEQIITQELQTDQLLEKVLQSVIWIRTPDGAEASGVLISKSLGIAVTNAHVTKGNEHVNIYFPLRDSNGNLISDREFYTNKRHSKVLLRLGYLTSGRVIAENAKTDLAIVSLDGLPQTAREIDLNLMDPLHHTMAIDEPIYILGNPAGRGLWRPEAGHFKGYSEARNAIQITASVYFGNSGGPVVNKHGELIGIISRSHLDKMKTWAVTMESLKELLNTLEHVYIFSIKNNTRFTMHYQVRWTAESEWEPMSLKKNQVAIHWNEYKPEGYPKIRFDHIANDDEISNLVLKLDTYTQNFGADIRTRISWEHDAREYHFGYNFITKKIKLYDSEE